MTLVNVTLISTLVARYDARRRHHPHRLWEVIMPRRSTKPVDYTKAAADMTQQSLALWQNSLDLYRKNPMIGSQQAMIDGMNSWLRWQSSMMKLWTR